MSIKAIIPRSSSIDHLGSVASSAECWRRADIHASLNGGDNDQPEGSCHPPETTSVATAPVCCESSACQDLQTGSNHETSVLKVGERRKRRSLSFRRRPRRGTRQPQPPVPLAPSSQAKVTTPARVSSSIAVGARKEPSAPLPPQFVYWHHHSPPTTTNIASESAGARFLHDLKGHRLLQVLPAQIDMSISAEAYASTLAVFLDDLLLRCFRQHNNAATDDKKKEPSRPPEQFTVLLDVRAGGGWPNPPALQMVGLIRHLADELGQRYPNRLHKCFVFPLPRAAVMLWKLAIQPFLDPKLRECMELVAGHGTGRESPPPNAALSRFVALDNLELMERHRRECFC